MVVLNLVRISLYSVLERLFYFGSHWDPINFFASNLTVNPVAPYWEFILCKYKVIFLNIKLHGTCLGVTYGLASLMLTEGMLKEGFATAEGIYRWAPFSEFYSIVYGDITVCSNFFPFSLFFSFPDPELVVSDPANMKKHTNNYHF